MHTAVSRHTERPLQTDYTLTANMTLFCRRLFRWFYLLHNDEGTRREGESESKSIRNIIIIFVQFPFSLICVYVMFASVFRCCRFLSRTFSIMRFEYLVRACVYVCGMVSSLSCRTAQSNKFSLR